MINTRTPKLLLTILLALGAIIVNFTISPVFAARPDSLKDVITDSRPTTASNHTITLDLATGTTWAATETLTVSFNSSSFDTSGFANSDAKDYDIAWAGSDKTVVAAGSCAADSIEITTVNTSTDTFTFTLCSGSSASSAGIVITIEIGTNATFGTPGDSQIVNPSAGSYQVTVAGNYGDDSQDTVLVITSGVTVSATIDETLTTTVAAVVSGSCDTTGGTTITSTSTTIPFATINTEAFYDICQSLTVGTNAAGGYTVTVNTIAGLDAGSSPFSVGSCDGACTLTTPNTWATATNNGYAVCMKDATGDAGATASTGWDTGAEQCGGGGQKFELVADISGSDVPSTIMSSATSVSGDISRIGWRLSADAAQAAGTYTGTAVYVTTGTF